MRTFEELEEVVHSINEMEEIFKGIAIEAAHFKEIQRHTELKDQVVNILVQDVHRIDPLCDGLLEVKGALAALSQNKTFLADIEAAKLFLTSAITKAEGKEE